MDAILFSAMTWLNLTRLTIVLLTLLLAWLAYRSNLLLKEFQPDFNMLLSPPEVLMRMLLVGVCLLLAWLSGLPAGKLGLSFANPASGLALGLLAGVALQLLFNLLAHLAIKQFGRRIYSPWLIRNILPRHPAEWPLVAVALVPAVALEELLFRTLWLGGFGELLPLPLLILGLSVIFGLMHRPQGKLGMLTAGGANILFSILFIWSGKLLVPLTSHYTINLLQLVVAYYQRDWLENY